jgi:hypothetical protein
MERCGLRMWPLHLKTQCFQEVECLVGIWAKICPPPLSLHLLLKQAVVGGGRGGGEFILLLNYLLALIGGPTFFLGFFFDIEHIMDYT